MEDTLLQKLTLKYISKLRKGSVSDENLEIYFSPTLHNTFMYTMIMYIYVHNDYVHLCTQ